MVRWFPSKVDWWLIVALCVLPLSVIGVWVEALASDSRGDLIVAVLTTVFVAGILFGLVFPMRYGLGDSQLIVRFGLCRHRIPLADITAVEPTRNPLASPALSLDRLSIQFGPGLLGNVMISPADRDEFLAELAQKSGLKREGDRLARV